MTEFHTLLSIWFVNTILAVSGITYYGALWLPAWRACQRAEVRKDEGVLRVCRRRLFRYTSRAGLKLMFTIFCLLRAKIIWDTPLIPISDESWISALVMSIVLLWLTADTLLARHYD